jgi:hypothetical protein
LLLLVIVSNYDDNDEQGTGYRYYEWLTKNSVFVLVVQ